MAEQKKAANIRYTATKMRIRSTYDENYVAALRAKIDWSAKKWDKEKREWVIDLRYRKVAMSLVKRFFQVVIEENKPPEERTKRKRRQTGKTTSRQEKSVKDPYTVLHLLPDAPPKLVDSAYRVLAKLNHPDVSDEPNADSKMKAINLAYESIKNKQ